MFGLKIISKSHYNNMVRDMNEGLERIVELQKKNERLSKDVDPLREQLNEKMEEINKLREQNNNYMHEVKSLREFKRDTLEAMGQIELAGFRLKYCTNKCKNCDHEKAGCKKYEFGKHQYCVIPE